MARSEAAQGMMSAGGDAIDPSTVLPGPTPETEPEGEGADIEAGAAIIEAVADSVDAQTGAQIREHLNAIRELAANAAPMEEVPPEGMEMPPGEGMPPGMPPEEMPV